MPKLSLNASKKTKHTPAGEIPVDWGAAVLSDTTKEVWERGHKITVPRTETRRFVVKPA